jgi:CIC family chloride channel protein
VYYHTLDPSHTLEEIESVFTRTREVVLPVVDPDKESSGSPGYTGLVLLDSIQPYLQSESGFKQAVVADDLSEPFVSINLRDTLKEVQAVFERVEYPELPVVDDTGVIVGFVRPAQVISEYHRALLRKQSESAASRDGSD